MLSRLINTISFSLIKVKPNSKPQVPFRNWKIVKGDKVQVLAGDDKNKVGKVTRVFRKSNKVIVKGVNVKAKYVSSSIHMQI